MKDERRSAFWMKQLDERILEYLHEEGWATPSMMSDAMGFSASEGHIRERCEMLRYIGFIDVLHGQMYELDTDGRLYLMGQVDARYRPEPTVDRVLRS